MMDIDQSPGGADVGFSRREFVRRNAMLGGAAALSGGASALLSACGGSDPGSETSDVTSSEVKNATGTINVYQWADYETDKQDAGRVQANWSYLADAAQLPIKAKSGDYDVFSANNLQMDQLFAIDSLAPIDTSLLTNYSGLLPLVRDSSVWKGPGGEVYAVPCALIPALLGYDADDVPAPKSIDDLMNPVYEGKIGLRDEPPTLIHIARAMGLLPKPEDPGTLTPQQLDDVLAFLDDLRPNIRTLFLFGDEGNLLARGDISVAFPTYTLLITDARKDGVNVQPLSGSLWSLTYVDGWAVHKDADMPRALQWINTATSVPALEEQSLVSLTLTANDEANSKLPANIRIPLDKLTAKSPILGPSPVESSSTSVGFDLLTEGWQEFKRAFA